MKRGMTFEYLMCRADLNSEVDFGVNDAIGTMLLWGSDIRSVEKYQKKAIRNITNSHILAHTEPLLKDLGLLKVVKRYLNPISVFIFNVFIRIDCDQVGSYCIRIMYRFHP